MKKSYQAFTLLELLVGMTIVFILFFGASRVNFNPQIDKQNADAFSNNIKTSIETIRNYALSGKWVSPSGGGGLIHPSSWSISIQSVNLPSSPSWNIQASYINGWSFDFKELNVDFINQFWKIQSLACRSISGGTPSSLTNVTITFTGSEVGISWCGPSQKILDIRANYKNFNYIITLNAITGVVEKSLAH